MALKHRMLTPTINFETLNEHIHLEDSPFYINTELKPWVGTARRAAVSTFGFSGTNAHLVIDEFTPEPETRFRQVDPNQQVLFLLSARSEERLADYAVVMHDFIAARPELELVAMAYTL
jgi:polyketide synthase PksN